MQARSFASEAQGCYVTHSYPGYPSVCGFTGIIIISLHGMHCIWDELYIFVHLQRHKYRILLGSPTGGEDFAVSLGFVRLRLPGAEGPGFYL